MTDLATKARAHRSASDDPDELFRAQVVNERFVFVLSLTHDFVCLADLSALLVDIFQVFYTFIELLSVRKPASL